MVCVSWRCRPKASRGASRDVPVPPGPRRCPRAALLGPRLHQATENRRCPPHGPDASRAARRLPVNGVCSEPRGTGCSTCQTVIGAFRGVSAAPEKTKKERST